MKYENLQPIDDKVIIVKDNEQEKVQGVYVPETSTIDTHTGIIVAVGPGLRDFNAKEGKILLTSNNNTGNISNRLSMVCSIGDRVVYSKVVGQKIKIDGEELISQRESDIIAIIN